MKIIGLMSGTSADGVDVALCEIEGAPPQLNARILHSLAVDYEMPIRERILEACDVNRSTVQGISRLDVDLAEIFSDVILQLICEADLQPSDIDLISSHGQTIWHESQDGVIQSSLQIGSSGVIAERTGITTIADFRVRDIANGGQGAPLTSYVDWVLLRHPDKWRAVQNIGGMGNVTILPPLSSDADMVAFDTGPGNVLMDGAIAILTDGNMRYDEDGVYAKKGHIHPTWLEDLMMHPYLKQSPPKTTGRELFDATYVSELVQSGVSQGMSTEDIIATLTAFTALSIMDAYQSFSPHRIDEMIVGGGGQRNPELMRMLAESLQIPVLSHEDIGLSSHFKEALVFAVLAYETWHYRPSTLPVQTGAKSPSILGHITPALNYVSLVQKTWSTS